MHQISIVESGCDQYHWTAWQQYILICLKGWVQIDFELHGATSLTSVAWKISNSMMWISNILSVYV